MLGMSRRRALLACAASAVLVQSLVHRCSGTPTEEVAPLNHEGNQEQAPGVDISATGELQKQIPISFTLPEGKNPASQVASLNQGNQVIAPAFLKATTGEVEQQIEGELPSTKSNPDDAAPSRRLQSAVETHDFKHDEVFLQYPFKAAARRRLERAPNSLVDTQELLSEHVFPHTHAPTRRLQLFTGLPQLTHPFSAVTNLFGTSLSARDRDQLEAFSRRVATSRERVYKDLLFVTGGKHQGMDEYAMKQLIAKVGLENLSTGNVASNVQLSRQESLVLEAAKRSRFQIDRIIATYEREVAQHAKTLRQEMQADTNQQSIRAKINSITSEGLFRKHTLSVRRLQQASRFRRLAALLQGPGLLGKASSLLHAMDPSSITDSINASLGGLGLHHLHLPNIGGLDLRQDGQAAILPLGDMRGLQAALDSIFPIRQQATAVSVPLRSFQQGVSTATDGAIGAFLSKEGLLPFLSVDSAKQLLGSLIGGEAIAPHGASGWDDLGLSPGAAKALSGIMPFETFLSKLGILAEEVDADVGTLKRETKKRIGAEGFPVLPEQLLQVDTLLDRLVWGSLHPPVRRLQEIQNASETQPQPQQPQQQEQQGQEQQQVPKVQPQVPKVQPQDLSVQPQISNVQPQALNVQPQVPNVQPEVSNVQPEVPEPPEAGQEASEGEAPQKAPLGEPQASQEVPEEAFLAEPDASQLASETVSQAQQPPSDDPQEAQEPEIITSANQQKGVGEEQEEDSEEDEAATVSNLFDALLSEEGWTEETAEEQLESALQRIELLADAVTVLLKEYEKAVEHLQDLLDEQIETAEEIRDELKDQVTEMREQVATAQQEQQQKHGPTAAAKEVVKAYDEAIEGIKESLEGLLQQEQQQQGLSPTAQQELASMAPKIEAAAQERLPPPVAAP